MKNNMLVYSGAALLVLSSPALAQETLSAEQVTNLITRNTVTFVMPARDNEKFMVYFDADGSTISRRDGKRDGKGRWRVTSDDQHCTQWGKKDETCGEIVKEANGTYKRMQGGSARAIWQEIHPGKAFD